MSEMEQPQSPSGGAGSQKIEEQSDLYFADAQGEYQSLEERREELAEKQRMLVALDTLISIIDCDLGSASLTIKEDGTVVAKTSTPKLSEEVKTVITDYNWSKKFDIGYDTRSKCITWSLKSTVETLTAGHSEK